MNVTEFAEQIVFGTTLEDKLAAPGDLDFSEVTEMSKVVQSISAPGRPVGLAMQSIAGKNIKPPRDENLGNDLARGQLLHFLANHELLATELMALVLLKFPNAPYAFRRGVLVTLQEEQEHTRMYVRRMKECGVEFGSYPLSGQFWRVVEPMQSPLDFVARLSLTFEQANLDYSQHFAKLFHRLGDQVTADLLWQIYEDEIGHVKHGLQWFREWKNEKQTDWQAYQHALEFPMSPQRGRGTYGAFNREGRKRAGLNDEFIDAMEVFSKSRGRSTTVRWFDPGAESELAGENHAKAKALLQQLEQDLAMVLVAVSKPDDVILSNRTPSKQLRKHWVDRGVELPEFFATDRRDKLLERKLRDCSPWAWTPKNHGIANSLKSSLRHLSTPWHRDQAWLYRKSWSIAKTRAWMGQATEREELPDWFAGQEVLGNPVSSLLEVESALRDFKSRGYAQAIYKTDLGASGRGQKRVACELPLNQHDLGWLENEFARSREDGSLPRGILEPELLRRTDISFLWNFDLQRQNLDFMGWTQPVISRGRRFSGTVLGAPFSNCDAETKRFLLENRCARLQRTEQWLAEHLNPALCEAGFNGYLGVDAFVFEDATGALKIKPLVELNPRMTMGHIALSLEKRLAPGVTAEFRIFTIEEWKAVSESLERVQYQASAIAGKRQVRWQAGVIRLGEPSSRAKYVPALLVGEAVLKRCKEYLQS
ncbi:MAG: DUF455 family protein [Mariniblastus sp.]|nr:DUF455 family protein [Mariniblastus sp.]MDG2180586.1 DUF455 family protein [Mariniblastus sp.]